MGIKILVIDNNQNSLEQTNKLLESMPEDFEITEAVYDKDIKQNAIHSKPDIILLTLENHDNSGLETIQSLKSSTETKQCPIIIITDYSDELINMFELGILEVALRPLDAEALLLKIKTVLAKNNYFTRFIEQAKQIEKLTNVASKSSNSVAIINPDGRLEWVNEGFTQMYECSFREFKKNYEHTLFNPKLNPHFQQAINKTISDKSHVIYENKWTTPNGNEKWIQTTLTPVFDEITEKLENIIAIESDVSQLKKTEKKLEEQNKYLLKFTRHLETTNEILENQRKEIEQERHKYEDLLLNILPYPVAKQLISKGESSLRTYKLVSVMFSDFKGFTQLSDKLSVEDLIHQLSDYFEKFDEIINEHFIEKIKTIGDSYMCAGGLPLRNRSNPFDVVLAGLRIQNFVIKRNKEKEKSNEPIWPLRLGIHSGEVIAGVIGKQKFAYDIWGDCVNTASRMETAGEINKVNISGITYQHIKDYFDCSYRGEIDVKYKGEMQMYFVNRLLPEYSEDKEGIYPNEKFKKILASY